MDGFPTQTSTKKFTLSSRICASPRIIWVSRIQRIGKPWTSILMMKLVNLGILQTPTLQTSNRHGRSPHKKFKAKSKNSLIHKISLRKKMTILQWMIVRRSWKNLNFIKTSIKNHWHRLKSSVALPKAPTKMMYLLIIWKSYQQRTFFRTSSRKMCSTLNWRCPTDWLTNSICRKQLVSRTCWTILPRVWR